MGTVFPRKQANDLPLLLANLALGLANYQAKSRDKLVHHYCQLVYNKLAWLASLLFIYQSLLPFKFCNFYHSHNYYTLGIDTLHDIGKAFIGFVYTVEEMLVKQFLNQQAGARLVS